MNVEEPNAPAPAVPASTVAALLPENADAADEATRREEQGDQRPAPAVAAETAPEEAGVVIHLNERQHFEDLYLVIVIAFSVLLMASIYVPIYLAVTFHSEVFTPAIVYPRFLLNMALVPCYSTVILILAHFLLRLRVFASFYLHEVDRNLALLLWRLRFVGLVLVFVTWTSFFLLVGLHLIACIFAFLPATAFYLLALCSRDHIAASRVYPSYRGACSTSFAFVVWIAFPFAIFPKSYTLPQVNKPQRPAVVVVTVLVFLVFFLGVSTFNLASLTYFLWDILMEDPQLSKPRSVWVMVSAGFVYASWIVSMCLAGIRCGELIWAGQKPVLQTLSSEFVGAEHSKSNLPALASLVMFLGAILGDVCVLLYISFTRYPGQQIALSVMVKIASSSLMVVFSLALAIQKYLYGRSCFKASGFLILCCTIFLVSLGVGFLFIPLAVLATQPT